MRLPDFIIGGVQKSGTTLLHSLLLNHPQVKMLDRNMDYSYFDDDRLFTKGFDWYRQLFAPLEATWTADSIIGQTSADCAFNPQAVPRILEVMPKTKLIFVLRHPIERTYSLYWHQYSMAREHYRFEKAIALEPDRIKKSYHNFKHYSYLGRSRYKRQFDKILSLVPPEKMILLPFDALTKQTLPTVNRIFEFLGVSPVFNLEELNYSTLPRNSARIPTNHTAVIASSYLQKLGFLSVGRRLVNSFRVEQRPPAMNPNTKKLLEEELAEDIAFFESVKSEFTASLKG
ncbi:sulfotransferase family protein [Cyclobacterium sp. SYSU L10401]|uniref:sulfotransferase family protein n=1 Tax=Cyclobacterium sp. SYSU L10401 TaxID=2678657 RepID=UPI0013D7D97F|nr:sulfotransferase [Cyclobacterium sp. SYSU L10401]